LIKKAVILAAGSGTRMQKGIERYISDPGELSAIKKGEKMAVRFSRFPFLDYQILNLIRVGLKEINLVLKPEDTFFTYHYSSRGKVLFPECEISFSFQPVPDGTAHAVLCAREFVGDERFLVLNGDNNYPSEPLKMLITSPSSYTSMVAFDRDGFNPWVKERLRSFAVIKTCDGKLKEIVEKSPDPETFLTSDFLYIENLKRVEVKNKILLSMNLWCFNSDIMDACKKVPKHPPREKYKQGEYELPDAVNLLMEQGKNILVYYACCDILDLTKARDMEIVSRQIRENLLGSIEELEDRYKRLR